MDNETKKKIFPIMCIAGFVVILFVVPKIVIAIGAHFGRTLRFAGLPILFVAFFWFIWSEVCVRIKASWEIDKEEDQED